MIRKQDKMLQTHTQILTP